MAMCCNKIKYFQFINKFQHDTALELTIFKYK